MDDHKPGNSKSLKELRELTNRWRQQGFDVSELEALQREARRKRWLAAVVPLAAAVAVGLGLWLYLSINRAPSVAIASPSMGETIDGSTVSIRWTASDPDGDLVRCYVYMEKDDASPDTLQGAALSIAGQGTGERTLAVDPRSTYWVRVEVDDGHGHRRSSPSRFFRTAAPEPLPVVTRRLEDDFSSESSGWPVYVGEGKECGYFAGGYEMSLNETNRYWFVWAPDVSVSPAFLAEVDGRIVSGTSNAGYGILWGDANTSYRFRIRDDKTYGLSHRLDGVWQESPIPLTTNSAAFDSRVRTHRVGVLVLEDWIVLRTNRSVVDTIDLAAVESRGLALCVGTGSAADASVKARFDNFLYSEVVVFLRDDFAQPTSGWSTWADEEVKSSVRNGELAIDVDKTNWLAWSRYRTEGPDSDFAVKTTGRTFGQQHGICGILWGEDDDNFIIFQVDSAGTYQLAVQKDDAWQDPLVDWTPHASIRSGIASNDLRLIVVGDRATLIVNQEVLTTVTIPELENRFVALAGGTLDAHPVYARFDDFVLYSW